MSDYDGMTKAELYELATENEIEGRSSMTKEELIEALEYLVQSTEPEVNEPAPGSRCYYFRGNVGSNHIKGEVWAATPDEAMEKIRAQYGEVTFATMAVAGGAA